MEIVFRLLLRRLAALPIMILGVSALVFIILQFTPGDPATVALGKVQVRLQSNFIENSMV